MQRSVFRGGLAALAVVCLSLAAPAFAGEPPAAPQVAVTMQQSAPAAPQRAPAAPQVTVTAPPRAPAPLAPTAQRAAIAPRPIAPRADRRVIFAGASLSAIGIALGIGLAAASNGAARERDGLRSACNAGQAAACPRFDATEDRRLDLGNAAVWSFVAAGGFATATLTYAIVAPRLKARVFTAPARSGAAAFVSFDW